jgi:hypothetical protein
MIIIILILIIIVLSTHKVTCADKLHPPPTEELSRYRHRQANIARVVLT